MNPIEKLRQQSSGVADKDKKDAFLHNLRRNSVLTWTEELEKVLLYKRVLKECPMSSTLEIESGIGKINPSGIYISHTFKPYIEAGFSFQEVTVIMRAEIIKFEEQYGVVNLSQKEIDELKNLAYLYNRQFSNLDMSDAKKLIHLKQTAEVLYYLLSKTITFKAQVNGWCTLTFANSNYTTHDYCTIYSEEQINLLEKVNMAIGDK